MKKSKAIIVIGGSTLQLPGIQWAKDLGLQVILTDKNSDAPGRKVADQFEAISGNDIQSLLDLAHRVKNQHDIVGAYTSNDFGLPAVAAISESLGLPGCSQSGVKRSINKSLSREKWYRQKLPIPKGRIVRNYNDLLSAVHEYGFPLIIKPTNSSGSQGVCSVRKIEEIGQAYNHAKEFSNPVLVEQLCQGIHVDVNGLFIEGEFLPCGTMERFFSSPPYHYPVWGCEPTSLNPDDKKKSYDLTERAARILGIDNGPVKADLIWSNHGPVLLELAPRFHGDVTTSHATPLARNTSPIKAWLAFLGKDPHFSKYLPGKCNRHAGYMGIFPSRSGYLESIDGIDQAKAIEGVSDIYIRVKLRQKIKKHNDNRDVCGFIWATGTNREELHKTLTRAQETLLLKIE